MVTDFGKFADPLADKCLVTAAMLWFVEIGQMPAWALLIVIVREFAVSGLRMIASDKGRVIAAGWSGKVKTASTMAAIVIMLLMNEPWMPVPDVLNFLCVVVIVVTTLFQLHLANKVGVVPALLFAFVTTGWIGMAARVRMQFYRFKGQEYILAARTLGASDWRLMFKHIFPNSLGTIITGSVLVIPGVIFSESSLTYLGIINLESSTMTSVGTMLAGGKNYLSTDPYIILFPALFIALLEVSFNLFGNGLRDAFNPSLRGVE